MEHSAEYTKIARSVSAIEQGRWSEHSLSWCSDRVDWAWKWKKINSVEMLTLCDRITRLFNEGYNL